MRRMAFSMLLAVTVLACSSGGSSGGANDALLEELHAVPGAVEVGRTQDGASTVVGYGIEEVPGTAVLEFYLASLPAEWELAKPLGDDPEAVALCRDGSLVRVDAADVAARGTFTVTVRATGAEECD
ncbi:MAG: hypothetical protein K1X87_06230 [Dehalococcoidia bacterium]|nr:hypothetical protein [Dehalococcoidia bacterium]